MHSTPVNDKRDAVTPENPIIVEMSQLLEALCEDRLSGDQARRLEQLVLTSADARWYYVTYVDLHGSLFWNAAGVGSAEALSSEEIPVRRQLPALGPLTSHATPATKQPSVRMIAAIALTACACLTILFGRGAFYSPAGPQGIVENSVPVETTRAHESTEGTNARAHRQFGPPVELTNGTPGAAQAAVAQNPLPVREDVVPAPPEPHHEELDSREVVAAINSEIRQGWDVGAVRPSMKRKPSWRTSGRTSGRNLSISCWTTPSSPAT
jgi:hypothetical protein